MHLTVGERLPVPRYTRSGIHALFCNIVPIGCTSVPVVCIFKEIVQNYPFSYEALPHECTEFEPPHVVGVDEEVPLWGIGTRNGCSCAHPYMKCLMHVDDARAQEMEERILARDRWSLPGTVRAGFGICNTIEEVKAFCKTPEAISRREYRMTIC